MKRRSVCLLAAPIVGLIALGAVAQVTREEFNQLQERVQSLEAELKALSLQVQQISGPEKGACDVTIRAFIDGASQLVLRNGIAQWQHFDREQPGKWGGHKYATYINGNPWTPDWTEGYISSEFRLHQIRVPEGVVPKARLLGWKCDRPAHAGAVSVSTDEGAVFVDFDDRSGGATWYEATVRICTEPEGNGSTP